MDGQRTGTVTFVFTDVEGSTHLVQTLGDRYVSVLASLRRLLRASCGEAGGEEVDTHGDALFFAFSRARDALTAAIAAQRAMVAQPWPEGAPVRVRIGIHTGEPLRTNAGYVGVDVHRAARICAAGHGGQILLSEAIRSLVQNDLPADVSLRYLGEHRLKDLVQPVRLYQVVASGLPVEFPPLRSLATLPNNLPVQLTSFIGREREMMEAKRLLSATRLLTLTGAGGCGKTRLALHVAAEVLDEFPDGIWLVELATVSDSALLPQAVASALSVREQPSRPLLDTVLDFLHAKRLLLVFDNCEHLVTACAQITDAVLRHCPELRILVTSREVLGIVGETIWPVPPLTIPDPARLPSLDGLGDYEAVRLFIARARAVHPAFSLTPLNARAIARLCHQLDGIPLAIELAAARSKVLSAEEIAARLDDRFRLLTGGSRTALPRHQTLRATMNWSYELLAEVERVLFRRLSVFAGSFTLEAAEVVCAGEGVAKQEVLDLLSHLVDKSLVVVDHPDGMARYRFLDTVRQYSLERLLESGEGPLVRQHYLTWYLQLAERAEHELHGTAQRMWLDQLEVEHDNLRAALNWSMAEADEAEDGLRLAGALWWFWFTRGYLREGRERLEVALSARAAAPAVRAKALSGAAVLGGMQGDYSRATALGEESLVLFRDLHDEPGIAFALNALGYVARQQGDYERAAALYGESLPLYRRLSDAWGTGLALFNLGEVALFQGDHGRALALLEESLAVFRQRGDTWGIAFAQNSLGLVARQRGDHRQAELLCASSLALFQELEDTFGIASALRSQGLVAHASGDYPKAAARYEESLTLYRKLGDKWGVASSLRSLALVALRLEDDARATALCKESLTLFQEVGDRRGIADTLQSLGFLAQRDGDSVRAATLWKQSLELFWKARDRLGVAQCLRLLGENAIAQGKFARAARLIGVLESLASGQGPDVVTYRHFEYEHAVALIREQLGQAAFVTAWTWARAVPLDEVVEYALGSEDAT